ncbi:MAG: hypothetical protein KBT36_10615 [Kurthia sp.]|nr:hypothetical protein [Candidatus Kurthia equi]
MTRAEERMVARGKEPSHEEQMRAASEMETKQANSKKKKWPLITAIAVVILLIAGHLVIKSLLNPEKTIEAMDNDFQKENKKAFLQHFTYDKKTQADDEGFYHYIEEQGWSNIRETLSLLAKSVTSEDNVAPVLDTEDNTIIKVSAEKILGGLYQKVKFEAVPMRVEVSNSISDVQFKTVGKTVDLTEGSTTFIGDFLPGTYAWDAVIKSSFGKLPFEGEMKVDD